MKYLWMYRIDDVGSCAILAEILLAVPMTETLAVRELKTDMRLAKWSGRVLNGYLYRIDETVGLPAGKPTRAFKRDAKGRVQDDWTQVPAPTARPGDGMSKQVIGIYKLVVLRVHGGGRVIVTSTVTGTMQGVVYADGTVEDRGRLPADVIQAARDLAGKELGS